MDSLSLYKYALFYNLRYLFVTLALLRGLLDKKFLFRIARLIPRVCSTII